MFLVRRTKTARKVENKSLNEFRNRFALPGRCYVSEEVEQQEEELRVHHVQRRVRPKGAFGEH